MQRKRRDSEKGGVELPENGAGASVEKREQRCGKNQYIHMVK